MMSRISAMVLMVAMLVSASLVVGWPSAGAQTSDDELSTVDLVNEVESAVVTVINEQTAQSSLNAQEGQPIGAGTGFVIDEEGHIVTNWHVVTGGSSYSVILSDGTTVDAELIGEDPRDDLAVVKIAPDTVPDFVALGDSSHLQVGQSVVAIGSPLGVFGNTVTHGIVSALDRDQFAQGGICFAYSNLIQHDAPINPGNSGGPLFNMRGEVIGVNTLGLGSTGQGRSVQGLSFAVPSSTVSEVVEQLIETGFIAAPYLGISFAQLNPQLASLNDLPVDFGIYVRDVEESGPADQAGIQPDDIITSFGGQDLSAETRLSVILLEFKPGDTVEISVLRSGDEIELSLTLGEVPEQLFEQCQAQIPR
ncbi:MAG: S1C family serine protease [Thermomicrobiales bacterium]